jgi:PAS domain S-box-containing protein
MLKPAKLTAIENAFDGIALLDKSGNYMYMNKAHADLFGYDSADELYGKSWQSIYTHQKQQKGYRRRYSRFWEKMAIGRVKP